MCARCALCTRNLWRALTGRAPAEWSGLRSARPVAAVARLGSSVLQLLTSPTRRGAALRGGRRFACVIVQRLDRAPRRLSVSRDTFFCSVLDAETTLDWTLLFSDSSKSRRNGMERSGAERSEMELCARLTAAVYRAHSIAEPLQTKRLRSEVRGAARRALGSVATDILHAVFC